MLNCADTMCIALTLINGKCAYSYPVLQHMSTVWHVLVLWDKTIDDRVYLICLMKVGILWCTLFSDLLIRPCSHLQQ